MALQSVYIETTIVSYLVARPSRNIVLAAHQKLTKDWWKKRRMAFDLFVSQAVLDEIQHGERAMAHQRLLHAQALPVLSIDDEVKALASALLKGPIPPKAAGDALHIAVAAVHSIDFLLTWNCTHLANAEISARVDTITLRHGWEPPKICTPEALMGISHEAS